MYSKELRVLALTQSGNTPSARFRWRQYHDRLREYGILATESSSRTGSYPPPQKLVRPFWLMGNLVENLYRVQQGRNYDVCFVQRNLTSTLCTWEPLIGRPFIYDVDDAIFAGTRGWSADKVARHATLVVCGNQFLADHFSKFAEVRIIPTAVDSLRFSPAENRCQGGRPIIGWSGSSSGFKFLYGIEDALKLVLEKRPEAILKVVADREPIFKFLPRDRVVFERWTPEREVDVLREFTVGIMPLEDSVWSRGKCSFKMLTYMSVGVPVVVSPVGMNIEVLALGRSGYSAEGTESWVDAIVTLLDSPVLSAEMGKVGRLVIEEHFSLDVIVPKLASLLQEVA